MDRGALWRGLAAMAFALASSRARAEILDAPPRERAVNVLDRAQAGAFLVNMTAASVGPGIGTTSFLAGYDVAKESGVFAASAETFVTGRLALRAAAIYLPSETRTSLQPQAELRWQFLRRGPGMGAASLGLLYRRDSFTDDGGMIQVVASAARELGGVVVLANAAYGQDPEGDDRLTEVRCAGLLRLRTSIVLGAVGAAASGWGSTDRRRGARGDVDDELQLGASATYALGAWAITAQSGVDVVKTARVSAGPFALGGLGAVF